MASGNSSTRSSSTKRTVARPYVVVRVKGGTLTVVETREAKNQGDAMDAVVDSLPPAERNGVFGAFLAGSYREKEFATEQAWATSAKEREPTFLNGATPEPAPAPGAADLSGGA